MYDIKHVFVIEQAFFIFEYMCLLPTIVNNNHLVTPERVHIHDSHVAKLSHSHFRLSAIIWFVEVF